MTRTAQIAALEAQIERHHLNKMSELGVQSYQLIKALPEAEQIDWAAVASAKVEYETPIEPEDPDELAAKYLRLLGAYAETWVKPKAPPEATAETQQ